MRQIGSIVHTNNRVITILDRIGICNVVNDSDLSVVPEVAYLVKIEPTMVISIVKESAILSGKLDRYEGGVSFSEASNGNPYIRNMNPVIYKLWLDMIYRCYNQNDRCYKYYGGIGIDTCDMWRCFEYFYCDFTHIRGAYAALLDPDRTYIIDIESDTGYCDTYTVHNSVIRPFKYSDVCKCVDDIVHNRNQLLSATTASREIMSKVTLKKRKRIENINRLLNIHQEVVMNTYKTPNAPLLTIPTTACKYTPFQGTKIDAPPTDYSMAADLAIPNLIKKQEFNRVYMDPYDLEYRLIPKDNKTMCTIVK